MEQVFRIEIPVEVVDKTNAGAIQQLEAAVQKIIASMKQAKTTTNEVFNAVDQGASDASGAMQDAASAAQRTADTLGDVTSAAREAGSEQESSSEAAASAVDALGEAVEEVGASYKDTASSASQVGQKTATTFNTAGSSTDKFTQRVEKSNRTLRQMFKEKLSLTLAAIDKATPVLKEIWSSAKGLAAKTWHVAVKMKDLVTAPFRKLYNLINSPITMALSVAGIGFSASDVISTFTDFESGMSAVQSLSGATNEEFAKLKDTAKELGATTAFSATEASEGMQYLAMAGWNTGEIISAMPGLLDLAAAGATDLGTAADIVSDVMTAMGMEAAQAGRAADVFAKTATSTNTTIEGLGNTMKYAAPIAKGFGMSLEDVAAAAGLMANAGIKGEMAGTALRSSMLRMSSPTSEMVKTMKKLGISFSDSSGKMKSMKNIVRMLETSFAGLSESQRLTYAQDLFGTEAASAWLGVISQGADAYDKLSDSLYNASGAASDMANTRLDNLSGDMTILGSAVEGLKLNLVEKINPYLRQGVQWLTGIIPTVQEKLGTLIDNTIQKATQLKEFITSVFNSSEMQSADGIAEKFFVAWDKVIAEPFKNWWENGGSETMLGAVKKFGERIGETLHGIAVGIFAALKGEDIDFEGLNITGMAKAAAEMAKEFASSFVDALKASDIVKEMPGIMKTALAGFGTLKIGGGLLKVFKWGKELNSIFGGVAQASTVAAPAVSSVGTTAAASAAGVGKAATALGGLKTILAAIPGWGWAAAAVITAAAVGIKLYTDAQERERQELLQFSAAGKQAAEEYQEACEHINELGSTVDSIHSIELTIKNGKNNRQEITITQAQLASIDDKTAEVKVLMSQSSLTSEEINAYAAELAKIATKKAEIDMQLSGASLTQEQVTAMKNELAGIDDRQAEIEAKIAEGGLTEAEIKSLSDEFDSLQDREAAITMQLSGQGLTQEQLGAICEEYESLNNREAEITAKMSEAGMSEDDIKAVSDAMAEIGDKTAKLNVSFTMGSLTAEELTAYNQQLNNLYGNLIDLSNGQITQEDVDAGRVTDEVVNQVQQDLLAEADTKLNALEAETIAGRGKVGDAVSMREQYASDLAIAQTSQDSLATARINLSSLETERKNLLSQNEVNLAKLEAGTMTEDAYDTWYEDTFIAGMQGIRGKYKTDVAPYVYDANGLPVVSTESMGVPGLIDYGYGDTISAITKAENNAKTVTEAAQSTYDTQNGALVQQYENEKSLLVGRTFQGTDLAGMSLEDIAKSYSDLDESSQQLFRDAVTALNELNGQTDYISDAEKTKATDIVDIAAKAEVISNVQSQVEAISTKYQQMSDDEKAAYAASEEGAKQLAAVNEALASLGVDKIESLDQINTAVSTLAETDLSAFSLDGPQAAFVALGGEADGCKTKVDAFKQSLDNLDGTTATTSVYSNFYSSFLGSLPFGKNAEGGIYNGAMLSLVAEDGPEAIIPLGSKRRDRGIDLWLQAGKMLGIDQFADGGIMAPYTGEIENIADDDTPILGTPGTNAAGGAVVNVTVSANPTFSIDGGTDPETILEVIKSKQKELAEILGGAISDQLEDIISNIA